MSAIRGSIAAGFLALTLGAIQAGAAGPAEEQPASIDCARERGALAIAICGDKAAVAAERRLTATYLALYFSLEDDQRPTVRKQHADWLTELPMACTAIADPRLMHRGGAAPGLARECVTRLLTLRSEVYRGKLSGDALEETNLSAEARKTIQQRLTEFKFLSGSTDGMFGASTRVAIRHFQEWIGHPQGNFLTAQERDSLLGPGVPPGAARNVPAELSPLRTGGPVAPLGAAPGVAAAPVATGAPDSVMLSPAAAPTPAPSKVAPVTPPVSGPLAAATSAFPPAIVASPPPVIAAPPAAAADPATTPRPASPPPAAIAAPPAAAAPPPAATATPPAAAAVPAPASGPAANPPTPVSAEPVSTTVPPPTPAGVAAPAAPTADSAPASASPAPAPALAEPFPVAAQAPLSAAPPAEKTDATDQGATETEKKPTVTQAAPPEPQPTERPRATADVRADLAAQANGEAAGAVPTDAAVQAPSRGPSASHSVRTSALSVILLGAAISAYYFFWHRRRLGRLINLDELAPIGPRMTMRPAERTYARGLPPGIARSRSWTDVNTRQDGRG